MDDTLTSELRELLNQGAWHKYSRIALPFEVKRDWEKLRHLVARGYARWSQECCFITDAGRDAIGAPDQQTASWQMTLRENREFKEAVERANVDAVDAAGIVETDETGDVYIEPETKENTYLYSRRRFEVIIIALVRTPRKNGDGYIESEWSFHATPNGDATDGDFKRFWITRSKIKPLKDYGRFVIVSMYGGFAMDRRLSQETIPRLSKKIKWTAEEKVAWREVQLDIREMRRDSNSKRHKSPRYERLRYGEFA